VHPYLGAAAAHRELERGARLKGSSFKRAREPAGDPFEDLDIRITFRTATVLAVISAQPGASNRVLGEVAGVTDQGQMSKLLRRLKSSGLIENQGAGHNRGEPNAWKLTARGRALHAVLGVQDGATV
jgi:DNA-binding MarR family transcriptional regulator